MSTPLYYGEIVARISAFLHTNPAHVHRITYVMSKEENQRDNLWSLCADAGKIFDSLEELSEDHFINWHNALDCYANSILNHLLAGTKPSTIDLISMMTRSIETVI